MKSLLAIVLGFALFSGNAFAHADRIILIKKDGTLYGIPAEFGPAVLLVKFASKRTSGPPVNSLTLRLGPNMVSLPSCITSLLKSQNISQIKASASWYHDEKNLPYYLVIEFGDPGFEQSTEIAPYYSILFNLHTGKLMKMERVTKTRGQGSIINWQTTRLDVASLCDSASLSGFASLSDLRP